jgi:hypothetical protein
VGGGTCMDMTHCCSASMMRGRRCSSLFSLDFFSASISLINAVSHTSVHAQSFLRRIVLHPILQSGMVTLGVPAIHVTVDGVGTGCTEV